jgi:hypothetical protein
MYMYSFFLIPHILRGSVSIDFSESRRTTCSNEVYCLPSVPLCCDPWRNFASCFTSLQEGVTPIDAVVIAVTADQKSFNQLFSAVWQLAVLIFGHCPLTALQFRLSYTRDFPKSLPINPRWSLQSQSSWVASYRLCTCQTFCTATCRCQRWP